MPAFFLTAFLVIAGVTAFALIVRRLWQAALTSCAAITDDRARRRRALALAGGLSAAVLFLTQAQTKNGLRLPLIGGDDPPQASGETGGLEMEEESPGESDGDAPTADYALPAGPAPATLPQAAVDAGFVFVGAVTDIGTAWVTNAPGDPAFPDHPFGFSELGAWLPAPAAFTFLPGTNAVSEIFVSSSGTLAFNGPKTSPHPPPDGLPDDTGINHLAPFQTLTGVTPPAGTVLYEAGTNAVVVTWRGVTPGRAPRGATNPCSATVQAELYPGGDFTFRYHFPNPESFPVDLPFLIGAQNDGGGQTVVLANSLAALDPALFPSFELRWRSLDGLAPSDPDQDGDGLTTLDELFVYDTDFRRADTDGDGISDADEIAIGSNPFDPDENGDGIADGYDLAGYNLADPDLSFRLANGIGPGVDLALDSDADGWPDWLEGRFGTDPHSAQEPPAGLTSHFLLTASLTAVPSGPGVLSVGERRVLVTKPGTCAFWLPAGQAHAISFASHHGAPPTVGIAFSHPAAALAPAPAGAPHGGYGAAFLPLLTVEPADGWCCHGGGSSLCAVFTAHALPLLPGAFVWTADDAVIAVGTNRVEVGHGAGSVRVFFTAAGAAAAVGTAAPQITHCSGFYESLCGGVALTNTLFANTDDDDGDGRPDNGDTYVHNENDLQAVTPFAVPSCCACPSHSPTNWSCRLSGISDNLRVYTSTNKSGRVHPYYPEIDPGRTLYVEGLGSSVGGHADWLEWRYDGVVESPDGGLDETNFTVRTVWTAIDLLAAPVRLEPITAVANAAGTVVNPAGVAVNGVAVYRVEIVPAGIVPDEAIHWSKSNDNVTFYAGQNTGREAYIRGVTPGDFTLEISVDGFPGSYQPYIHGRVLTPTMTPIHVYIICSNGVPAVSTNTVNAWVAEANRIYRQAAMSFYVGALHYVESPLWFRISNDTEFYDMCSYANGTGGLELYCVAGMGTPGLHSDMNLVYGDPRRGMAARSNADTQVLAHEVGHACGLRDIYTDNPETSLVSEGLVGAANWSGGEDTGFHDPHLMHNILVRRLLMHGMVVFGGCVDIPLDSVMELGGVYPSPRSVGIDSMGLRIPKH